MLIPDRAPVQQGEDAVLSHLEPSQLEPLSETAQGTQVPAHATASPAPARDDPPPETDAADINGTAPESPTAAINSRLSSLLEGLEGLEVGSLLAQAMSDAASRARNLFYQYQPRHSPPAPQNRQTTLVKRDAMFPTRRGEQALYDDYEILGDLSNGSGAFGRVMIVQRWKTEQLRACKAVKVRSAQERELIDTEIELLKSLVHPNIVELHAVYFEDSNEDRTGGAKVYLVCEYCQGGDLLSRITHHYVTLKEPMSESHVAYMMQQILSATHFCHNLGIMHRDLKPQNILFQTRSRWSPIKIIDYGLADFVSKTQQSAKEVPQPQDGDEALCLEDNGGNWLAQVPDLCFGGKGWVRKNSVRHVMQVAGTTPYMAPEVFAGWYDHRFDNFSIGVILYECLCGKHPFFDPRTDDARKVKANIRSGEPIFPADVFGTTSYGAINLCKGLLKKDPDERITALQALEHPWLQDPEKPSAFGNKGELTLSMFKGLVSYPAHDKFRRAVYLMLTKELSEQQTQELRKLFMALDETGNGILTPKELLQGMQHVGIELPEEELGKLVAALSPSGTEQIQYREFISALIQRRVKVDRAQLFECFRKFDIGGIGRIRYEDVRDVLSGIGDGDAPGITESEWAEVVSPCAAAGTKTAVELTFDDFVALLEPSASAGCGAAVAA